MELVNTALQVKENLATFENYLYDGSADEQQFAYDLIQRGSCFIAYQVNGELRFSPSRYIGYLDNTKDKHLQNTKKDGRETNPAINKILDNTLAENEKLELKYLEFANELGIKPDNRKRKYWKFDLSGEDYTYNTIDDEGFPEGKLVERKHKSRERNKKLISKAKEEFLKTNTKLYCQICRFDFVDTYGEIGHGFIEAHHTVPVSEMKPDHETLLKDIALVCSNCHKMLHRSRPWLSMDQLKDLLSKKTSN